MLIKIRELLITKIYRFFKRKKYFMREKNVKFKERKLPRTINTELQETWEESELDSRKMRE